MANIITIEGRREGYAPDQIRHTMTVGDLINYLEQFESSSLVMIQTDHGYMFGSIDEESFNDIEDEEEE